MRERSSSLLLITVLWTSTQIKLLHENTEYRQDNLSVYGITSKIMPRIMQVPWYAMDEGKSQVNKGSLVKMMKRAARSTLFWGDCSWKLSELQGTHEIHTMAACWRCEEVNPFLPVMLPTTQWIKRWSFFSTEPCLHISLRSPKLHALPVLKNATLAVVPWSAPPGPPPPPCP